MSGWLPKRNERRAVPCGGHAPPACYTHGGYAHLKGLVRRLHDVPKLPLNLVWRHVELGQPAATEGTRLRVVGVVRGAAVGLGLLGELGGRRLEERLKEGVPAVRPGQDGTRSGRVASHGMGWHRMDGIR